MFLFDFLILCWIILFTDSVIDGYIPAGRANHYKPSLKVGSTVKVDRFEVARCSRMYKITDHPFLIHPTNHYWWSHHGCSWDYSPVMIRLFDNFQVIANINLELSCILSYCSWVYIIVRYHNWYLNSQMWMGKSVLSRALTSPKKQFESLSVSSLTSKKQSTHNSLHITVYIGLTSMIKNISYPRSVVIYLSPLLIKLISYKPLFYSLKEITTTQTIKTPKTRIPKNMNH